MDIQKVLALRGPNIWSRRTVVEAWVDLGDLRDAASDTIAGFCERLAAWLPGLEEHRCGLGVRGGFLMRLREGTYPAHILEHVTIELQNLAGTPVGFGKARETSRPGVYRVAVRYREEAVGRACLWAARDLVLAAMRNEPFDVAGTVARLRDLASRTCQGPSTRAVVDAAEARDIPWERIDEGNLVMLGHGARQHRVRTPETDEPSADGTALVASLFSPGEDGRIPLACVTGVRLRARVARRVFGMLRAAGRAGLGLAASDGLFLDDRRVAVGDHADGPGARGLLRNPALEVAVVEAHPAGILGEGLGFDKCSVAAVTDIGDSPADLHHPFVETFEDVFTVLRCPVDVVRPGGVAVLDAGEPLLLDMMPLCAGQVTLVAADAGVPALGRHLAAGGRAVTVRDGRIVFRTGDGEVVAGVVPRGDDDARVALLSAAIGWALGLAPGEVAAGLERGRDTDPAKQTVGSCV